MQVLVGCLQVNRVYASSSNKPLAAGSDVTGDAADYLATITLNWTQALEFRLSQTELRLIRLPHVQPYIENVGTRIVSRDIQSDTFLGDA